MALLFRTYLPNPYAEGATLVHAATLQDEAGVAIPLASLTTVTLTIYNQRTSAIVNARDETDIKNAGPGAVSAGGVLTLTLTPADMAIVDAALPREPRVALIAWTYASGAKAGHGEIIFDVLNLVRVP